MAKLRQLDVSAKLRLKNLFLLFGFFLFGIAALLFFGVHLPTFIVCIGLSISCVWALVTPTVAFLPAQRHAVVSLDISGASKSIRFVRTELGTYTPFIFTPKTEKATYTAHENSTCKKGDNGSITLTSDIVQRDKYTPNGLYHKTHIEGFEYDLSGAIVVYCCLLCRSKKGTIFNAVELRPYLHYLQTRIFFAAWIVRGVLLMAKTLYYSFLILGHDNSPKADSSPSPTLSNSAKSAVLGANTVVASENTSNEKEVRYV